MFFFPKSRDYEIFIFKVSGKTPNQNNCTLAVVDTSQVDPARGRGFSDVF